MLPLRGFPTHTVAVGYRLFTPVILGCKKGAASHIDAAPFEMTVGFRLLVDRNSDGVLHRILEGDLDLQETVFIMSLGLF